MKQGFSFYIILCLTLFTTACKTTVEQEDMVEWTQETKAAILAHKDVKADSVFEQINLSDGLRLKSFYKEGLIVRIIYTNLNGEVLYRAVYAPDTNYRYVQEYHSKKRKMYEGVEYMRKPYGYCINYNYRTGKILSNGCSIGFTKAGKWDYYNIKGALNSTTQYPFDKKTILPEMKSSLLNVMLGSR